MIRFHISCDMIYECKKIRRPIKTNMERCEKMHEELDLIWDTAYNRKEWKMIISLWLTSYDLEKDTDDD